jgi:hypothetical protein
MKRDGRDEWETAGGGKNRLKLMGPGYVIDALL